MQAKRILGVVFGVAVGVGLIGLRFHNKAEAEADIKAQAHIVVQTVPGYDEDPAYFDDLFDQAHPPAFESAYDMGGRRRSASFDGAQYFSELFGAMAEKAAQDDRQEVASELRKRTQAMVYSE